eukprot:jgi/Botrbrau1/6332/Bobra.0339s0039.1
MGLSSLNIHSQMIANMTSTSLTTIRGPRRPHICHLPSTRLLLNGSPILPPVPRKASGPRTLKLRPPQAAMGGLLGLIPRLVEEISFHGSPLDRPWLPIYEGSDEGKCRSIPTPRTMAGTCAFLVLAASTLDGQGMLLVSWLAARHVLPVAYAGFMAFKASQEHHVYRGPRLARRLPILLSLVALQLMLKKHGGKAMTQVAVKYPPFYEGVVQIPTQAANFIKQAAPAGAMLHNLVTYTAVGLAAALAIMLLKSVVQRAQSFAYFRERAKYMQMELEARRAEDEYRRGLMKELGRHEQHLSQREADWKANQEFLRREAEAEQRHRDDLQHIRSVFRGHKEEEQDRSLPVEQMSRDLVQDLNAHLERMRGEIAQAKGHPEELVGLLKSFAHQAEEAQTENHDLRFKLEASERVRDQMGARTREALKSRVQLEGELRDALEKRTDLGAELREAMKAHGRLEGELREAFEAHIRGEAELEHMVESGADEFSRECRASRLRIEGFTVDRLEAEMEANREREAKLREAFHEAHTRANGRLLEAVEALTPLEAELKEAAEEADARMCLYGELLVAMIAQRDLAGDLQEEQEVRARLERERQDFVKANLDADSRLKRELSLEVEARKRLQGKHEEMIEAGNALAVDYREEVKARARLEGELQEALDARTRLEGELREAKSLLASAERETDKVMSDASAEERYQAEKRSVMELMARGERRFDELMRQEALVKDPFLRLAHENIYETMMEGMDVATDLQLKMMRDEFLRLQQELEEVRASLVASEKESAEMRGVLVDQDRLKEQLQEAMSRLAAVEETAEMREALVDRDRLQQQLQEVTARLAAAQKASGEIRGALVDQVGLRNKLQETQQLLVRAERETEELKEHHSEQLEDMAKEHLLLQGRVADAWMATQRAVRDCERLKADRDSLIDEQAGLEQQRDDAVAERDAAVMEQERLRALVELTQLGGQGRIAAAETDRDALQEALDENERLKSDFKTERWFLSRDLTGVEKQRDEVIAERDDLRSALALSQQSLQGLADDMRGVRKERDDVSSERDGLRESLRRLGGGAQRRTALFAGGPASCPGGESLARAAAGSALQ